MGGLTMANQCGCNHWGKPTCPERGCRWNGRAKADTTPAPPVPGSAATQLDAMVTAYLDANDAYWRKTDELPKPPDRWRTGNPREATRVSLLAALAAVPQQAQQPAERTFVEWLDEDVGRDAAGSPVTRRNSLTDATQIGAHMGWSAALTQQVAYPLPDSLYPDSKDWLAGSYAARVEWLHTMYESKKSELGEALAQQVGAGDSERLDWIERKVCDVSRLGDSARTVRISWNNGADYAFVGPRYYANWREAIDAAMKFEADRAARSATPTGVSSAKCLDTQ